MKFKIDKINGTGELLKKLEEADRLIRELKSVVTDLMFDGGLSVDVSEEKTTDSN